MTAKSPANSRRKAAKSADPAQESPKPTAGERLMAELARDDDPYSLTLLIVEACRMADRLEAFDELLAGRRETWMKLKVGREVVEVYVDKVLAEARQCATVFRHYLADIHRQRAGIPTGPDDEDDPAKRY
ncbi:terminase small subunit [Mycobacterium phage Brusacoram]|uniref:Terminase small subunit n=7 Tax=Fishburnevirus TaxID=1983734 RepID=A0A0K1Y619_9CAUD|nr:terminase small subunit [Mycobacterium phage Brusacoram]YP_009964176.1 terminase small subunit [Mycobacterium phage Willsammy]YP_009964256.1 terminase small subunit [Mycobacterium phage Megiddo]YP_009964334.1 terminase small subunit [Mycobacterium phage Atcoo]YP_009964569.1 terminase small subunit [Mycobacterium phage Ksquared]YP_010001302.1 terminase small subunit [Mycobacterium phage KilKor]ASR84853.1 terminase small subunit [Mycobacterium phage StevieRay]ATW59130.1 terminase small subu